MMKHRPLRAISLIDSLALHDSIFTSEFNPSRQDSLQCAQILDHLSESFQTRDEILWLGAALSPFRDLICKQKKKEVPAISVVLSDGLKASPHFRLTLTTQLSTDIKSSVTNLFTAAEMFRSPHSSRSALGMILQNPSVRPWSRSIVWAAVMDILPVWSGWNSDCNMILERYLALQQHIKESGLDLDIDKAPLINVSFWFARVSLIFRDTRFSPCWKSDRRLCSTSFAERSTNGSWTTRTRQRQTVSYG
jgi:tRNA nucleotidyltransferase (CCA-adding enzyme)